MMTLIPGLGCRMFVRPIISGPIIPFLVENSIYETVTTITPSPNCAPEFSPDGFKMYIHVSGYYIYQYELTTAWDITTASYTGLRKYCYPPALNVFKINMSSNGLFFIILDYSNTKLHRFDLSTAWDISTASLSVSFDLSPFGSFSQGMEISQDGMKFYIFFNSSMMIKMFSASSAFDISSLTEVNSYTLTVGNRKGMWFDKDGYTYLIGNYSTKKLEQYVMTTPWDITTSSFLSDKLVSLNYISGIAVADDYSKLYVPQYTDGSVQQFVIN